MSAVGAYAFALKHYANRREILKPFLSLRVPVVRSHLLRYMLLEAEGGISSNLHTTAMMPIKEWIPLDLKSKVHAVVGLEYEQRDGGAYPGMEGPQLRFRQEIMAASRGHPLMSRMVADIVHALQALAVANRETVAEVQPSAEEALQFSGPSVWTRAVLKTLSEVTGTEMDYRNFTGMKAPRVFGDVMVLPVDSFEVG